MLRKFLNKKKYFEREKEDEKEFLLPDVIEDEEESEFSIIDLINEKVFRLVVVILGILFLRQYLITQDLQAQIDFNKGVNLAADVKEEISDYKQIFSFYKLDEMIDEIDYYEKKIGASTTLEELQEICTDYYNWKVYRGLEENPISISLQKQLFKKDKCINYNYDLYAYCFFIIFLGWNCGKVEAIIEGFKKYRLTINMKQKEQKKVLVYSKKL